MSTKKINPEQHILFVKNLPYGVTSEELYNLFGKYGAIRQVRIGNDDSTKGSAFVVFEDSRDAKVAIDKLSGFSFQGRYLVVVYHSVDKMTRASAAEIEERRANLQHLKQEHNVS